MSWGREQRQRNLSIPAQIDQINQFVSQKNEISISHIYKEIHSAYRGKRPIFHQMLKDIKKDKSIHGLIVMKWDRISRNPDDYLKLQNVRWKDNQIDIISVTEPMISSYLGRYLIRDLQNRSILYSEELSFRVKLGQRKKLQLGGYLYAAPFWFIKQNGYLLPDPDKNKAEIVKFVFDMYSSEQIGMRELAKLVRKKFKTKFAWKQLEHIIGNPIYYGVYIKERNLSSDEYAFFWAKQPWKHIEKYPIKHIEPLISKELFDRCEKIRKRNNPYSRVRSWVAKYPKIFQCSCGRNLRRYNVRNRFRYFGCPKEKTSVFPDPCTEPTCNLNYIEEQAEEIVRSFIPSKSKRQELIKHANKQIAEFKKNHATLLRENLQKVHDTEAKLDDLATRFAEWEIDSEIFVKSSALLNGKIKEYNEKISAMEKQTDYLQARRKLIEFIKILWKYWENLDNSQWEQKSSRVYIGLFTGAFNLSLTKRKISTYVLKPPFSFFKVHGKVNVQGAPRLNVVHPTIWLWLGARVTKPRFTSKWYVFYFSTFITFVWGKS